MPPNILPSPSNFDAGPWATWIFFFIAGAAVVLVALPWAIRAALKHKNFVPLIAIAGGFLCSLLEPMLDVLGHLHWARDLPMVFTNFGIDIPWLIPPCYAAFLGLESYFCYYMMHKGVTVKQCFMVFGVGIVTDAVMETVGINLGVYHYYGVQPFELFGFPYWWGFINGGSFFMVGFIMWFLVPRLHGWRQLFLVLTPPCGMMVTYFGVGWPHILAINSEMPTVLKWVAAVIMMAGILGMVRGVGYFVAISDDQVEMNWTLGRIFAYRFMLPSARERMLDRMSTEAAAKQSSRRDAAGEVRQSAS